MMFKSFTVCIVWMVTQRASLESVIETLALPKKWPFHRAVYDAAYTGCVLSQLEKQSWQSMVSVDYYRPPTNAQEEIYLVFERYSKFVSQLYPSREEAMEARNVSSMVCYKCGRNVTRRMNWFSDNNRKYFGLAYCPRHGWLKGKIRVKHCDGQVFMIKTMKLTDAEGARKIKAKSELMKKRRMEKAAEKGCAQANAQPFFWLITCIIKCLLHTILVIWRCLPIVFIHLFVAN